jgi:hypothetical protein
MMRRVRIRHSSRGPISTIMTRLFLVYRVAPYVSPEIGTAAAWRRCPINIIEGLGAGQ